MALFDFFKKKNSLSDILELKICSTEIPAEISNKIDEINWMDFGTAYGNAGKTIPNYLKNLFCNDLEIANGATHQLWCSLCHQHAYISDASLPAYDILKIGLLSLADELKIEILDIFLGFAFCTSKSYSTSELRNWEQQLRQKLIADREIFNSFTGHSVEYISIFATKICGSLDDNRVVIS